MPALISGQRNGGAGSPGEDIGDPSNLVDQRQSVAGGDENVHEPIDHEASYRHFGDSLNRKASFDLTRQPVAASAGLLPRSRPASRRSPGSSPWPPWRSR